MKYFTTAETAKLIREALKESFSGIKFSVKSKNYSGGSSITIDWTDGPTEKEVQSISNKFEAATFDGMTDYKGGKVHIYNGEQVHFGADFIFTIRHVSPELTMIALNLVAQEYGTMNMPNIADIENGNAYNISPVSNVDRSNLHHWSWGAIVRRQCAEISSVLTAIKIPSALQNMGGVIRTY